MTTSALLTPYTTGPVLELGNRLWRKQILKFGRIRYGDRVIDFTPDYARELIENYRSGVIEQVPYQLADHANRHTNDPERTRGLIKGLDLTPDGSGLDAFVETTPEGTRVLEDNPNLGVSARILEGVEYADGRKAGRVLQHVLGTLDPHLSGMRPWQAVTLASNTDAPVLDLTGATYEHEEPTVANPFTDEEIAKLRDLLSDSSDDTPTDGGEPDVDMTDEQIEAELRDLGITDLDSYLASLDDDGDGYGDGYGDDASGEGEGFGDDEDADVPVAAALANTQIALDLANAQGESNAIELARVRAELDEAQYARERDQIARESGIPPRIVDLAKPLLLGTGNTVDLANGDQVDAGQVMRKVFDEMGSLIKVLDLSGELGHALELTDDDEAKAQREELAEFSETARSQFGL